MDSAKNQLVDRLKGATNILVTVSRNPSVDQLAACIGLALLLNKLNKHTAAVFSGQIPSTIEFLKPEETLEKNTDSLRDFIIALDKSKADKLRYKVEDNIVRIFITPYRTSISQDDLEFSEGDFNVDVVVTLGVRQQEDLDEAITAHGRILHDATVASINTSADGGLGSINWQDPQASSLSELVTDMAQSLGDNLLDNQIATALLTGIVAETDRFSNQKTSSQTMNASAALMAAGANQQLVATKLEESGHKTVIDSKDSTPPDDSPKEPDDGTLEISHDENKPSKEPEPKPTSPISESNTNELDIPTYRPNADSSNSAPARNNLSDGPKMMTEPPSMGGVLSANIEPEGLDMATDPLSLPSVTQPQQLLDHNKSVNNTPPSAPAKPAEPATPNLTPPPSDWIAPPAPSPPSSGPSPAPSAKSDDKDHTLTELEASVHSPHLDPENLEAARDEVDKALNNNSGGESPTAIQALNAQPLGDSSLHSSGLPESTSTPDTSSLTGLPPGATLTPTSPADQASSNSIKADPDAPPPVPPPIPFQFGNS